MGASEGRYEDTSSSYDDSNLAGGTRAPSRRDAMCTSGGGSFTALPLLRPSAAPDSCERAGSEGSVSQRAVDLRDTFAAVGAVDPEDIVPDHGQRAQHQQQGAGAAGCCSRGGSGGPQTTPENVPASEVCANGQPKSPRRKAEREQFFGAERRVVCFICGTLVPLHAYVSHAAECNAAESELRSRLLDSIKGLGSPPQKPRVRLPRPKDSSIAFLAYNSAAKAAYKASLFRCPACSSTFGTDEITGHVRKCSLQSLVTSRDQGEGDDDAEEGEDRRSVVCFLCGLRAQSAIAMYHYEACSSVVLPLWQQLGLFAIKDYQQHCSSCTTAQCSSAQ
eukprot:m51a1_g937 hypothetical protein (334) ;mRNA; r:248463-249757